MVRVTGLEPVRRSTRPSNVPVCLFQHTRAYLLLTYKIIHTIEGKVKKIMDFLDFDFSPNHARDSVQLHQKFVRVNRETLFPAILANF